MPGCTCKSGWRTSTKRGSRGVVGQVAGLLTLLLALVLGTLIGVSFAYFSTQRTELEGFSAQILRLDQALAEYGPETKPARDKLKAGIVKGYETFWGGGDVDPNALSAAVPLANAHAMNDFSPPSNQRQTRKNRPWRRLTSTTAWSSNRDC